MTWNLALGYIFFLVLVFWFAFAVMNYATHRRFWRHRHYELLLVRVPLGNEVQPFAANHTLSERGLTVELLERLATYRIVFTLEVAVHHVGEELHFYISIPTRYKRAIIADVKNLFPGATLTEDDYDPWIEGAQAEIVSLKQSKPSLIPLKSAVVPTNDSFSGVLRSLSRLKIIGEGAAIQFVVRPISVHRHRELVGQLTSLLSGAAQSFRMLDERFLATPDTIELLKKKFDSPLFSVNGRIVVAHQNSAEARRISKELAAHCTGAEESGMYNRLEAVVPSKKMRALGCFTSRVFDSKEEMLLNAQELSSLFHFPTRHSTIPKAHRRSHLLV